MEGEGGTKDVVITEDGQCGNGWACEHRWAATRNMPWFRAVVGDAPMENWVAVGENQIAFSRGNRGFVAINNDGFAMRGAFQTGMAPGAYCNIAVSDMKSGGRCVGGHAVLVKPDGTIDVDIDGGVNPGLIVIHAESRTDGTVLPSTTRRPDSTPRPGVSTTTRRPGVTTPNHHVSTTRRPTPTPGDWVRTIVFMDIETRPGETVWLRGGTETGTGQIEIRYRPYQGRHFEAYMAWSKGDDYLSWEGRNPDQGSYKGHVAYGRPMAWTNNVHTGQAGYVPENKYGSHYWMWDVELKTTDKYIQFKSLLDDRWERDISHTKCLNGESPPSTSNNHWARVGYVNVFHFDRSDCSIDPFPTRIKIH